MNSLTITIDVRMERPLNLLITALDHGVCNYWCTWKDTQLPEGFDVHALEWVEDRDTWDARTDYFAPFVDGGFITFEEVDAEDGNDAGVGAKIRVLDRAAVRRGLQLMAAKHPEDFADLMNENDDSGTADVFMQLCLLGEVLY